jgi:Ca-activated chloride channel homolog
MSCTWIVAALDAVYWLLPGAWAQDSREDVHITPRVEQTQTKNGKPIDDPTLKTHTKPIKVDVNLVLVPVSIVDPENRQVTGLDKENFEVFEGKDRQQIQHFSSEDAPVSLGAIFDVSGSMANKIERAREAVVEFFKTANPEDEFL